MNNPDKMTPYDIRCLQEFEKLYDRYMLNYNRKDLILKKVYHLETYALCAINEFVIMATITHNRTDKETREIFQQLYVDVREEEKSCFILN